MPDEAVQRASAPQVELVYEPDCRNSKAPSVEQIAAALSRSLRVRVGAGPG
jgi:hypothetical protein